jgi:putative holliday junction resolvase
MEKSKVLRERILGVDLGRKRIGLAVGFRNGPIFGLDTIVVEKEDEIIDLLVDIIEEEEVNRVVFGLPLSKSAEPTNQSKWVKKIAQELLGKAKIKVSYVDEYLTSWQSKEIVKKGDIDQQSAILILKDYFDEE